MTAPLPQLNATIYNPQVASPAVQAFNDKSYSLQARLKDALAQGQIDKIRQMSQRGEMGQVIPEWQRATSDHNFQHLGQDYTLDEHNLRTLEGLSLSPYFSKLSADQQYMLRVAALFHDVTKKTGTVAQRAVDQIPSDPRHPQSSAAYLKRALPAIGFTSQQTDQIVFLVHHHSDINPGALLHQETLPTETLDKMAQTVGSKDNLHMLMALSEADTRAVSQSQQTGWTPTRARRLYRVGEELASRLQSQTLTFAAQRMQLAGR